VNDNGDRETRNSVAEDAVEWVERAFARDATPGDDAAMLAWGRQSPEHARALRDALFLRGRLINASEKLRADPAAAALLAEARAMPEQQSRVRMGRRAFLTGAVAASAAGIAIVNPPLGLWPSLGELRADYRTGTGERKTVQVAQNLTVELNTRTAVSHRQDDRAYRLELISGEVAVNAGRLMRPAVIETDLGEASTSDGQFSAQLRDDGMCVTCFAGAVAVRGPAHPEMRLERGQQTVLGRTGTPRIITVDANAASGWQRGVLIFNDRPLAEIVHELNRYRSGRLVLTNDALGKRTVSAVFDIARLDIVPAQMRAVAGATVTNLPGGIVLLS